LREVIGVSAPITHRWAGVVGYTEDGLPIFEEVRPRVWALGAYSGTGNVVGAICGRAAAQMVVTGRTPDAWFLAR
jgi:gamma-glutamylputrescine oxidase